MRSSYGELGETRENLRREGALVRETDPTMSVPSQIPTADPLRRGPLAPPPRTLVDILRTTADAWPDSPAIDNGETVLTYAEFLTAAEEFELELAVHGVGLGDRVGIRITSGTADLYVAIAATLLAGAAYVPVDADDPDERARTVFGEAGVAAIIGNALTITSTDPGRPPVAREEPGVEDDAWIIFTSGSTGKPKGVAVTHRNAAAFVDAESRMFLQDNPIGPDDRVMAGLSVAFDASCEEMWLAWRYGACLVPAPRSLVRSGTDLGPWLIANQITVVSTVPTLVLLWPAAALDQVRLLILGGEACPPEIGLRFATPEREVWNTYGPTEATVVACGARVRPGEPVRIGLPLDGWDLAVVDPNTGIPVPGGELGELIIGGVGLARYLDPAKDAEKYAPMPTLGWERAYRSGDLVRLDPDSPAAGLLFQGRADDQVKVGGRRIELGEIDATLTALPGVKGAAAAVRKTKTGNSLLVGYVAVDDTFDRAAAIAILRRDQPAALVPRLAVVDDLPTRTSGKIDRDALPWPVHETVEQRSEPSRSVTEQWIAELWRDVLGADDVSADADFFDLGGGSLSAAQAVGLIRARHPGFTVAEIYEHPTLAGLAAYLDELEGPTGPRNRPTERVPRKTQIAQVLATVGLRTIAGLRWLTLVATASTLAHRSGMPIANVASWWWLALGWLVLITPPGRMLLAAGGIRVILRGVGPGNYPRGGRTHLRIWLAERWAAECGAVRISGAPLLPWYARLLGARIGTGVDLHTAPPVTGLLRIGDGASVEPEVDLMTHWLDGDRLFVGSIRLGPRCRIGARTTIAPDTYVHAEAEIAAGSGVVGEVGRGEYWAGSPSRKIAPARGPWESRPAPIRPSWRVAYAATAVLLDILPFLAGLVGFGVLWPHVRAADSGSAAARAALVWLAPATLAAAATLVAAVWILVRLLGNGLAEGHHPIHSRPAWQAWTTFRILDEARWWLYPLYASSLTPAWFRSLGASIGADAEVSTAVLIPKLTAVGEGAFLADDTLIGGYELGGGWLRVAPVKIGKRAFVGNSGMAAPGRKVPKASLVAVLSAAPRRGRAKAGTSWVGSPPERLRRQGDEVDAARTHRPALRLRILRGAVEVCRLLAVLAHTALLVLVTVALLALAGRGWWLAAVLAGVVFIVAGLVAAAVAVLAKWLLVGRVRPGEHPLWSSFVWRNELADAFVESLAAPWFAEPATGTTVLVHWLRAMGARIGHGAWIDTYWLPEPDLIDLREGATVNAGCVVQTHLFHDRLLRMDTVTLDRGATLGPNSVVLPAAVIGRHATIGPASLVMRGEVVPDRTRWIGNPIGPWLEPTVRQDRAFDPHDTNRDDPDEE